MAALAEIRRTTESPVAGAARRLNAGQLGAIYVGRMEYGPRALGARSILANPSRRETHDLLNKCTIFSISDCRVPNSCRLHR